MPAMNQLEQQLDNLFEKNLPKLPDNARKMLAEWAPWVALVVGALTLLGAWGLWSWASVTSSYINSLNAGCNLYLSGACDSLSTAGRMTAWVWLGLAVLIVEGLLYLLAFPGLRDRKKAGWNYLYWGALVNVAYAVVVLLTGYGVQNFVFSLVGSAIGFWLLFQIRSMYMGERRSPRTETKSDK